MIINIRYRHLVSKILKIASKFRLVEDMFDKIVATVKNVQTLYRPNNARMQDWYRMSNNIKAQKTAHSEILRIRQLIFMILKESSSYISF